MTFDEFLSAPELPELVQRNFERYRSKWEAMYRKAGTVEKMAATASFSWAAFLLSGPWLFYRKMYLEGGIWAAAVVLLTVAENITGKSLNAGTLGLCIAIGMYGNGWYFKRTYKKLSALRGGDQFAGKSGGVSWAAAVGTSLAVAVVVVVVSVPESGWTAFRKGYDGADQELLPSSVAKTQPAPAVAAAFEPAGEYDYRESGSSGGLALIRQADGRYAVSIGAVDDKSFHECSIGEEAGKPILILPEPLTDKPGVSFRWHDGNEPNCSVDIEVLPGSASVSIGNSNCSAYCGTGEDFTGVYVAKAK